MRMHEIMAPDAVRLFEARRYASAVACLCAVEGDSILEARAIVLAALRDVPGCPEIDEARRTSQPIIDLVYASRLDADFEPMMRHKAGALELRYVDYVDACKPFAMVRA